MIRQSQISDVIQSQMEKFGRHQGEILRDDISKVTVIPEYASIITGMRRVGKSTLLRQIAKYRDYKNVLYLNFDDIRLSAFDKDDFVRLYNEILDSTAHELFFDEIQLIAGWEMFIHQLLRENYVVYISGSNAAMLSTDLGTHLTGRHISSELFPFSYQEFLTFLKKKRSTDTFFDYLLTGGIPEYVKTREYKILSSLLDDVLVRDIAVNKGVKNVMALRQLAVYLLTNTSRLFSANKLTAVCGVNSATTVLEYISYMKDAYLLDSIGMYNNSLQATARNPKKVYAYDTGLVNSLSMSKSPDYGRLLENLVFIRLRHDYDTSHIFYGQGNGECDFITTDNENKSVDAIQVCYDLNDDNFKREMNGLEEAMKTLGLVKGTLITLNEKDSFDTETGHVDVVKAMDWI